MGYFNNGSMLLLQIDGEEDIEYGPDLFEVADLLVSLGVESGTISSPKHASLTYFCNSG